MPRSFAHARLLALPEGHAPDGGRLEAVALVPRGRHMDLVMDFQALALTEPPVVVEAGGQLEEHVRGSFQPRRLRFLAAAVQVGADLGARLAALPPDDPRRDLSGAVQWRTPEGLCNYMCVVPDLPSALLRFTARGCLAEPRAGAPQPVVLRRTWSPPPAAPARRVPNPRRLRARYGGDPVVVQLGGRRYRQRLFIGGLDTQLAARPEVDVVLNVGDEPSRWAEGGGARAVDRWEKKGEGREGMSPAEIAAEARWVAERLQAGQRVLVHCSAGMNRSGTICCVALMQLEGLTAEAALARVRAQHPWARPDSIHWLKLRWLAQQST